MAPDIDESLLDLATSANIACGGHVGNDETILQSVRAARRRGLRIGAHPSYPDRKNFGRVSMSIEAPRLLESLLHQIEKLASIAETERTRIDYVKPHGALYNDAAASKELAGLIFEAAEQYGLRVMALAGSAMATMHPSLVITEGFIDRGYRDDGTLIPRSNPGALILDPETAAAQALQIGRAHV